MSGRRNFGGALVAGFVLLVAIVLGFLPSGDSEESRSALSAADDGRRAVFLLLQELGIGTDPWRSVPGELDGGGLLWIPRIPEPPVGIKDLVGEELAPGAQTAVDVHDSRHYRRFVDEGGTILFALPTADAVAFAEDVLDRPLPFGLTENGVRAGENALVLSNTGESLVVPRVKAWPPAVWSAFDGAVVEAAVRMPGDVDALDGPDRFPGERELDLALGKSEPHPAIVRVPVGRGSVLFVADDGFADNGRLRRDDHALLVVRLVERFGDGRPVIFDEYSVGRWAAESALSIAASPRLLPISLGALLLVVVWTLGNGWPRAFPRDPVPPHPLSALSRARAEANFLLRAGRLSLLAARLREGVLARLDRTARARRVGDAKAGDATGTPKERVRALLGQGAEEDEVDAWVARLETKGVASLDDLEQFARGLEKLSHRVSPTTQAGARRKP